MQNGAPGKVTLAVLANHPPSFRGVPNGSAQSAAPMGANPESRTKATRFVSGFRVRASGAPRNDRYGRPLPHPAARAISRSVSSSSTPSRARISSSDAPSVRQLSLFGTMP